jgi:hypothetical protein
MSYLSNTLPMNWLLVFYMELRSTLDIGQKMTSAETGKEPGLKKRGKGISIKGVYS